MVVHTKGWDFFVSAVIYHVGSVYFYSKPVYSIGALVGDKLSYSFSGSGKIICWILFIDDAALRTVLIQNVFCGAEASALPRSLDRGANSWTC